MKKLSVIICVFVVCSHMYAQSDSTEVYKKRVLEMTEINFLTSYYSQDGDNAAVSGGIGTEELTDATGTFIISIPMNDDDVLTIDAGVSAYTSASSSNVDPFDSNESANAYVASSGASASDLWANLTGSYSHSSDDRNSIWTAKASVSSEYDYFSIGFGGNYSKLFNEKNTEVSVNANIYLDTWKAIYPIELRPFGTGAGLNDRLFTQNTITGNAIYNPNFKELDTKGRNSYALGFGFSQILSKRMQGSLALDLIQQNGLLSTPFQRVYFSDVEDSFIQEFQLADDIERLPDSRFKIAIGGRLNYYLNETFVLRTFYRYYFDNWGIKSQTASVEIPIKIAEKFTLYPSYRYYNQSSADCFAPYEQHLSSDEFYTSDYDLSNYNANQYGLGLTYTDIFAKFKILSYGLKSFDIKYSLYDRNSTFSSSIITAGIKFVDE